MKFLIASDIHGSSYFCQKLLEAFDREKADKLLLLGDLLYHGPRNDLPRDYDPKKVIELLNATNTRILSVRGNCDSEVDQMVLQFPIMAEYCILEAGGQTVYATHGHHFNIDKPLAMGPDDILLYGHTHIPLCAATSRGIFLNPGSVSIPKESSPHGYMTLENGCFQWKELSGTQYREFNPGTSSENEWIAPPLR